MASNPYELDVTPDEWVLVAADVTSGLVWVKKHRPNIYVHTYVASGGPPPTINEMGAPFRGIMAEIISDSAIDVYVRTFQVPGRVRVDL